MWDTLSFFQKRRFQGSISKILRTVSLLGEKFIFLTPLGHPNFNNFENSVYTHVVLLITFQNNLNYTSALSIQEVIKFYNIGEKTFETDFNQ